MPIATWHYMAANSIRYQGLKFWASSVHKASSCPFGLVVQVFFSFVCMKLLICKLCTHSIINNYATTWLVEILDYDHALIICRGKRFHSTIATTGTVIIYNVYARQKITSMQEGCIRTLSVNLEFLCYYLLCMLASYMYSQSKEPSI